MIEVCHPCHALAALVVFIALCRSAARGWA